MKTNLFSKRSLLVGLKAIASGLVSNLCTIPVWALSMFFINKGIYMVGGILTFLAVIINFLFFGYFSSRWWAWK